MTAATSSFFPLSSPNLESPAVDAAEAVEEALRLAAAIDGSVRAWAHLDPGGARQAAAAVDARGGSAGPLRGLTFGAKDNFDTADQPTEYGSPIFAGHRPAADAGAVALLRDAGAVLLGKTVTAELAMYSPGPTANPHRLSHTPGGSSSGSAAAVASGMADIALGTQTAGSVIRPASFCGVLGFRPTFGTVTVGGVKLVAPSLDTVGWFARTMPDLDAVRVVLRDGVADSSDDLAQLTGVKEDLPGEAGLAHPRVRSRSTAFAKHACMEAPSSLR